MTCNTTLQDASSSQPKGSEWGEATSVPQENPPMMFAYASKELHACRVFLSAGFASYQQLLLWHKKRPID